MERITKLPHCRPGPRSREPGHLQGRIPRAASPASCKSSLDERHIQRCLSVLGILLGLTLLTSFVFGLCLWGGRRCSQQPSNPLLHLVLLIGFGFSGPPPARFSLFTVSSHLAPRTSRLALNRGSSSHPRPSPADSLVSLRSVPRPPPCASCAAGWTGPISLPARIPTDPSQADTCIVPSHTNTLWWPVPGPGPRIHIKSSTLPAANTLHPRGKVGIPPSATGSDASVLPVPSSPRRFDWLVRLGNAVARIRTLTSLHALPLAEANATWYAGMDCRSFAACLSLAICFPCSVNYSAARCH
jgi:hypothetical protein